MENKPTHLEIKLKLQSGSMMQFEKTGSLPNYLVFTCRELRKIWRFKLKEDTQNGVLKVNGQMAFQYFFDDLGCTIQSFENGLVAHEWQIDEIVLETRD